MWSSGRPVGTPDCRDGGRGPAAHAGRPSAHLLRPLPQSKAAQWRSAGRCCATKRNSAYMRDTGDPTTAEGGQIEWGYEEHHPRLHPRDLLEKEQARQSPSQRDLAASAGPSPWSGRWSGRRSSASSATTRAIPSTARPQTTTDGGPSMGESQKVRGLWYAVGIWVKDGPGMGKLIADWMTDGRTAIDHSRMTTPASPLPAPGEVHRGAVHRDSDLQSAGASASRLRAAVYSPLTVLRAGEGARRHHGARGLGARLRLRGERAPAGQVRRPHPGARERVGQPPLLAVSNAEHLDSENCGIINLSHFYICDIEDPAMSR